MTDKQKQFVAALYRLVEEHGVEIAGEFTIWPLPEGDDDAASPLLSEVRAVTPEGIDLGPKAARRTPKPWTEEMIRAYEAGVLHKREDSPRPENYSGFDAYYWLGWNTKVWL